MATVEQTSPSTETAEQEMSIDQLISAVRSHKLVSDEAFNRLHDILPREVISKGPEAMEAHLRKEVIKNIAPDSGLLKAESELAENELRAQEGKSTPLSFRARLFSKNTAENDLAESKKKIEKINAQFAVNGKPLQEAVSERLDAVRPNLSQLQEIDAARQEEEKSENRTLGIGQSFLRSKLGHAIIQVPHLLGQAVLSNPKAANWIEEKILKPMHTGMAIGAALMGDHATAKHWRGVASGQHDSDGNEISKEMRKGAFLGMQLSRSLEERSDALHQKHEQLRVDHENKQEQSQDRSR